MEAKVRRGSSWGSDLSSARYNKKSPHGRCTARGDQGRLTHLSSRLGSPMRRREGIGRRLLHSAQPQPK